MYSFDSRVRYSETDSNGRLSLFGAFNYLQDCSTFHSEDVGVGFDHLTENHLGWMLTTWEVQVLELPKFNEEIRISTWCYEMSKLYGMRNFTIERPDGTCCLRADSKWFLYDFELGRPIKVPPTEREPYTPGSEPRLDMPPLARKVRVPEGGEIGNPVTVTAAHLDTNFHVNNARYIDMATAATGVPFEKGTIEVQFHKGAVLGDVIVPRVCALGDGYAVELASPDGTVFVTTTLKPSSL